MIIAVTNRQLPKINFLDQLELIAKALPHAIILREKDLPEMEYQRLAQNCNKICVKYNVPLIIHHFIGVAKRLGIAGVHLPMDDFSKNLTKLNSFLQVGVSVHRVEEAVFAAQNGASYLIAGHIFSTDCKKGTTPRGLDFLKEVSAAVDIPVFAIGGISPLNAHSVTENGAAGICVMSGLMACDRPDLEMAALSLALKPSNR